MLCVLRAQCFYSESFVQTISFLTRNKSNQLTFPTLPLLASLQTYPRSPKSQSNQHKIRIEQNQTIKSTSSNSQALYWCSGTNTTFWTCILLKISYPSTAWLIGMNLSVMKLFLVSNLFTPIFSEIRILTQACVDSSLTSQEPVGRYLQAIHQPLSPSPQIKSENSLRTGHLPICILRFLP